MKTWLKLSVIVALIVWFSHFLLSSLNCPWYPWELSTLTIYFTSCTPILVPAGPSHLLVQGNFPTFLQYQGIFINIRCALIAHKVEVWLYCGDGHHGSTPASLSRGMADGILNLHQYLYPTFQFHDNSLYILHFNILILLFKEQLGFFLRYNDYLPFPWSSFMVVSKSESLITFVKCH